MLITARKLVTTFTYNLHTILHLQSATDEWEALRVKAVGQQINYIHLFFVYNNFSTYVSSYIHIIIPYKYTNSSTYTW